MLTPTAARDIILDALPRYGSERVDVEASVGRVLHEPITAERDQPPFDRVMMDGIAARSSALDSRLRRFRIQGTQHAGESALSLQDDDACIEVMTGAVLPPGADTVIPVERITVADGFAELEPGYTPARAQFVHPRASDHAQGVEVLSAGTVLSELDVAILASCGRTAVEVAETPTVRVVSTGSELVPAGAHIEPHQIRLSNGPALVAMLSSAAFDDTRHDHLIDEPAVLEKRIAEHLEQAQILVLSGGVSMGKADFVPATLAKLGVEKVFHRISQRPGKPMWFGVDQNGTAVFALPRQSGIGTRLLSAVRSPGTLARQRPHIPAAWPGHFGIGGIVRAEVDVLSSGHSPRECGRPHSCNAEAHQHVRRFHRAVGHGRLCRARRGP